METLKQRLLEHIADLLDEPTFDMDMRLRDCIDPLPNDQSELHLLMTDAAFKVFCNYFSKQDTTKQCAINGVVKSLPSDEELGDKLNKYILRKSLDTESVYTETDAYIDVYKLAKEEFSQPK